MAPSLPAPPGREAASKLAARKVIVPVVPRAFERKSHPNSRSPSVSASSGRDSWDPAVARSGSVSESHEEALNGIAVGGSVDHVERSPDSAIASANVPSTRRNGASTPGSQGQHASSWERSHSHRSHTTSSTRGRESLGSVPDGVMNSFHSKSAVPPTRFENGIVFGGSEESNQSSPTIPPSTGSTYTQPTPLSAGGLHASQSGYKAPPRASEISGNHSDHTKTPESATPAHGPSSRSLSGHASNAGDSYQYVSAPGSFLGMENLQSYLLSQFDDSTFSDCLLDIDVGGVHMFVSGHSLVLARSPTLRYLLLESGSSTPTTGKRHLQMGATNRFVTAKALRDAIRVCYGAPVPSPQRHLERDVPTMRTYLADLAAGQLLELFDVAAAAAACARQQMTLANVEELLSFIFADSPGLVDNSPSGGMHTPPLLPTNVQGPWTFELVGSASSLILAHLTTSNFVFDRSAPPSTVLGGFPALAEESGINGSEMAWGMNPNQQQHDHYQQQQQHKRGSSSVQLMGIHFGDFPSAPDAASITTSSLLLSLPFSFLRHIILLARPPFARDIVAERERRRRAYLRSVGPNVASGDGLIALACWKESFDPVENDIRREWALP